MNFYDFFFFFSSHEGGHFCTVSSILDDSRSSNRRVYDEVSEEARSGEGSGHD